MGRVAHWRGWLRRRSQRCRHRNLMLLKTPRRGGGFRASRVVLDAVEMIVCSNPFEDQLRGLISSLDGVVQFLWSDTLFLASPRRPRSYICTLQEGSSWLVQLLQQGLMKN